jgi:hypothetical protein
MKRSEQKAIDSQRSKGQAAKRRMYVHLMVLLLIFGSLMAGGLYFLSGRQNRAGEEMVRLRGRWQRMRRPMCLAYRQAGSDLRGAPGSSD